MGYFLQQLASAIPIAALYALLAFGYAVAFAVTRRADLTYGALFGFTGQIFLLFVDFGWNRLWLVLPAALAFGAAAAMVYTLSAAAIVGRTVMQPLAMRSANAVVVASLGVSLALMEMSRLAAETRTLWLSPFLNTPVILYDDSVFPVTLTVIQILNAALMVLLVIALHLFVRQSRWGRFWRAVSQDEGAAALCGVSGPRIFITAYMLSAVVAAAAGILATAYYGTMDFGAGLVFGVKVLFIAAIGGQTTPLFAAAGAAVMGLVETLWSAYAPTLWRDVVIYAFLILLMVVLRKERVQP